MRTGRIVELTFAVGNGGVAAWPGGGSAAQRRGGAVNAIGCAVSSTMTQP
jgi:hypothetical protein